MKIETEFDGNGEPDFLPLEHGDNILLDERRLRQVKAAIDHIAFPGAKIVELGSGIGVLSWFASSKAQKIWCVELNKSQAREAARFLAMNPGGEKVVVEQADAFDYLPPEPVDIIMFDIPASALQYERQIELVHAYKQRYLAHFGGRLPTMMPTAILMAIQPLQQNYNLDGFLAPMARIQQIPENLHGTVEMARPALFQIGDFAENMSDDVFWEGKFVIEHNGHVNALRIISKSILAIVAKDSTTIDGPARYASFPLNAPLSVQVGETLCISFRHRNGDDITALQVKILR
jgi:protein arginine N-methyltransferase 1